MKQLGAGAFGVVYQVFDRERKMEVALKTLQNIDAQGLYLFKQEFRALTEVVHPNLAQFYELFSDGQHWFFTMELIEGLDFLSYVRDSFGEDDAFDLAAPTGVMPNEATLKMSSAGLDGFDSAAETLPPPKAASSSDHDSSVRADVIERLRRVLPGLIAGVNALHSEGMLHRDIKPANVMVTPNERVVLLDFGLARPLNSARYGAESLTPNMVGTPLYMSPEQASDGQVAEPTDWYSVGVMIYEALTGKTPFSGSVYQVLTAKQSERIPRPSQLVMGIPEDLEELCLSLLQRKPDRRVGGEELSRRFSQNDQGPLPRRLNVDTGFIGRESHLQALTDAYSETGDHKPTLQYVFGLSGMGKSLLIQNFLEKIRASEPVVILHGRCYQQESLPYKAWDGIIDSLSRYLRAQSTRTVQRLAPRYLAELLQLFPVLERVEGFSDFARTKSELMANKEVQRRAFKALKELLSRLADLRRVMIHVDDLQWSDADSISLFREVFSPPDPPGIFILASYRSKTEASDRSVAWGIEQVKERLGHELRIRFLEVGRFEDEECRELIDKLTGTEKLDPSTIDQIVLEAQGSPYFISELVFFLKQQRENESNFSGELSLSEVLKWRYSQLPEDAQKIVVMVAIAGQPSSLDRIYQAAGFDSIQAKELGLLKKERFVTIKSLDDREIIDCYHSRIRDLILESLSEEDIRTARGTLATVFEETGADAELLANQFSRAGQDQKAAEYALKAADRAFASTAFQRAAELYSRVLDHGIEDKRQHKELLVKRAKSLVNAGRGLEGSQFFLEAAKESDLEEGLELKRRAAHELLTAGHAKEGLAVVEDVLSAVGLRLPDYSSKSEYLCLFARRIKFRLSYSTPAIESASEGSREDQIYLDSCWSVCRAMSIIHLPACIDFMTRHNLYALKVGDVFRLSRGLIVEAWYHAVKGQAARSHHFRREAIRIAQSSDDAYLHGFSYLGKMICSYFLGNWKTAWLAGEEAAQIFRAHCKGVRWELSTLQYLEVLCLARMGMLGAIHRRLPRLLRQARQSEDMYLEYTLGNRVLNIHYLALDQVEKAEQEVSDIVKRWREASNTESGLVQFWTLCSRIERLLYQGKNDEAWEEVEKGQKKLKQAYGMVVAYDLAVSVWGRAALASARTKTGGARDRLLREAERVAKRSLKLGFSHSRAQSQALRAGIAETLGQTRKAAALLAAAEEGYENADMNLHAKVARRCRGQLIGHQEGERLLNSANLWLQGQDIRNLERMTQLIMPGPWTRV